MARQQEDWFKTHRRMKENLLLMSDNNAYVVFTKLMLFAGKEKGEWFGTLRGLAELCNMSHNTLYHVLSRLEKERMVKRQVKHNKTVISICSWSIYQPTTETASETQVKHRRNTGETQVKQTTPVKVGAEEKRREENKNKQKVLFVDFEHLQPALTEFVSMRKAIKAPLTGNALSRIVARLETMHPNQPSKQQAVLLQSVDHNWKGVFELKSSQPTAASRFA